MRTRTIALIGSIAALSLGAAPAAMAASGTHHPTKEVQRADRTRDASGVRHVDRTADPSSADNQRDR